MAKYFKGYWLACVLSTVLPGSMNALAQTAVPSEERKLATGTEVSVQRFAATGDKLIVWLPSEHGLHPREEMLAAALAKRGVEVWLADMLTAHFLSPVASSMLKIPPADVAALIQDAAVHSHKSVYVLSAGRGAVPLLRGAVVARPAPAGIVLLYPNLYRDKPEPGVVPGYIDAVSSLHLPVFVVQPALSPFAWRLPALASALRQGGASVKVIKLDGIRNRYHFRPDATALEDAMAQQLPVMLSDLLTQSAGTTDKKDNP